VNILTRKDKKPEIGELQEEKSIEVKSEKKTHSESSSELKETQEIKDEHEEMKLLECKDQKALEFFSKDDLCEKIISLESILKDTEKNLEKFRNESMDWKNKFMRLQAEFENAQKRWDKNRQNLRLEYTALIIKSFLPLYDSFKKALSDDNEDTKILKGFYDQFMNILKSYKAEPIETKVNEQFDYNYHEALSSIEKTDVPNNTIIDIIQDGWKLDKEVIRYSKVILSKEPKPPEPEPIPELENEKMETQMDRQKESQKQAKFKETTVNDEKESNSDNYIS
jgi:molecular chaperone GrpE